MSYAATVFKVMIASPGDVSAERAIVRELLSEWNTVHSVRAKTVLLPVGWETHSVPEMGDRPQAIVNKQILGDCDLLVGVFWTRIGTATGQFASGTVEEIEEHIKTDKPAMLYFSAAPVVPDSIDLDQYEKLKSFKNSCQSRGLYASYSDLNDFRTQFYRQLQLNLNRDPYFQRAQSDDPAPEVVELPEVPKLSKEAAFMLKECAADAQAVIMNVSFIGGQAIQVRGKNLIEDGNDRSRAIWTSALLELESLGYIEPMSAKRELFRVTKAGYEAIDRLP